MSSHTATPGALPAPHSGVRYADHDHHHDHSGMTVYGFWIFLMSDLITFSLFFATYVTMDGHTAGGPGPKDLFEVPSIILQTVFLLASAVTFGMAGISLRHDGGRMKNTVRWLLATFGLGAGFLVFEMVDFVHMAHEGGLPMASGWLTALWCLVGLHGLHVTVGMIWILATLAQFKALGLTERVRTRVQLLGLYWHFLDLVWVGIFSIVFLRGLI